MNNWIFWIFIASALAVPFIFLAGTVWKIFLGWRVPITWISALPNHGWVEVTGRAKGDTKTSRLSQSPCTYWQLEVKEYQSSGRGGGRWRTVHKSSSGEFEVDDMTGRIRIQDKNFELVMNNESYSDNLDEGRRTFLENLGIKTKGFLGFNKKLRVYERFIPPGEEILVLGKAQRSESAISTSADSIVPLVISNFTKLEMIKAMFWRNTRPILIPMLISLAFAGFFIYSALQ